MPTFHSGRHEFGQNFLTDEAIIAATIALVAAGSGPIVEIGPGGGALTLPLQRLRRPVTAVEIDDRLAADLRRRVKPHVTVVTGDFLRYRLPSTPHIIVGNLPFHETTAMLRKLLHTPHWTSAVLLTQWEVARRRAGVGGATMMTAQWWPWYEFSLERRVPANAFAPRPSVDAGLLTIVRRADPLLPSPERKAYQNFVHGVFTGRGRGLGQILLRHGVGNARVLLRNAGLSPQSLPKDLNATAWQAIYRAAR